MKMCVCVFFFHEWRRIPRSPFVFRVQESAVDCRRVRVAVGHLTPFATKMLRGELPIFKPLLMIIECGSSWAVLSDVVAATASVRGETMPGRHGRLGACLRVCFQFDFSHSKTPVHALIETSKGHRPRRATANRDDERRRLSERARNVGMCVRHPRVNAPIRGDRSYRNKTTPTCLGEPRGACLRVCFQFHRRGANTDFGRRRRLCFRRR